MNQSFLDKINLIETNKRILASISVGIAIIFINLDAVIDSFTNPEVPYLSIDHVVVGIATGILIFFMLWRLSVRFTEQKKVEKALRESEEFLQKIIDMSPDGIIFTSLTGKIMRISPKAVTMSGYTDREEVIGHSIFDFIVPEERDRAMFMAKEMLKGNYAGISEYQLIKKDGTYFFSEINGEVIRDSTGRPTGMMFVERDITERKNIETDRESLLKDLQIALSEVNTLEGVVPICSSCKKIRDEQGIWNILEVYLTKHTDAQFSHGICPDCTTKYHAELTELKKKTSV
ncbi:MAG: PAS domain-containing protein [Bacteroidota bacterium]